MGAGTPSGVAIAVRDLRGWANEMDEAAVQALSNKDSDQWCLSDVVTGTDLETLSAECLGQLRCVRCESFYQK